ncbi:MAG TPA: alkaline phosphatase family protein [Bryobacteraceae bacterium]|nr:alkaline phosphatase family protein [Bryobacteraceae bacterium]
MKRAFRLFSPLAIFALALLFWEHAAAPRAWAQGPTNPKLVLAVVVDQFRYDYLTRFRSEYKAGFARLFREGAVFTDAHHMHFPTVTAIGHSTFLSGATPSISGIVGNEWFDRESGKVVTSVDDPETKLLGGPPGAIGSSPHRLLVSTVGDELKMSGQHSTVIGVSIKDRAAILPSGHMADGAYWFDGDTGNFVSSTFYFGDLPAWVKTFNAQRAPDKYANAVWKPFTPAVGTEPLKTMPASGPALYRALPASPYGNELIEAFAEQAIQAEQLGRHAATDILTVSFSSNDYVGHAYGPDSAYVHDMCLRTDVILGKLLDFVDQQIGRGNVLFVMTADHGVTPVPEVNQKRHMPGGRLDEADIASTVNAAITAKYGQGNWVVAAGLIPYLNRQLIADHKLDLEQVERTGADAVLKLPHIFRVYTGEEILHGEVMGDFVTAAVRNGYYPKRSGDIIVVPDPYYIFEKHGTSHGTPFNYDTHVPLIFMGPRIRAGTYYFHVALNDVAPTLTALLGIDDPSGSVGRVLTEMIEPSPPAH